MDLIIRIPLLNQHIGSAQDHTIYIFNDRNTLYKKLEDNFFDKS